MKIHIVVLHVLDCFQNEIVLITISQYHIKLS